MNRLSSLPELGVGVVYMAGLHDWLVAAGDRITQVEVEPQSHWLRCPRAGALRLDEAAFAAITGLGKSCLVHSVGCPVGASDTGLADQHDALRASVARLDPPWLSEHLSFMRFRGDELSGEAGFLLPPLQSAQTVALAANNLRHLAETVQRPVAFETGVNYLRPWPGELPDGAFFAAVAAAADCGILLDLHNLWANERNGRQRVRDVVAALPLERVIEVHLAGGEAFQGYWLDAHVGLCQPELLALAAELLPQLPHLKALTFEMMDTSLLTGDLQPEAFFEQLRALERLWQTRGRSRAARTRPAPVPTATVAMPTPEQWEYSLAATVLGHKPAHDCGQGLARDPGTGILRELIEAARAGTLVEALGLSLRLLETALGHAGLVALLARYWQGRPPLPFATDESARFGAWVLQQDLAITALADVVGFELACRRALSEDAEQTVTWHHHPDAVLEAIRDGRVPDAPPLPQALRLTIQKRSSPTTITTEGDAGNC